MHTQNQLWSAVLVSILAIPSVVYALSTTVLEERQGYVDAIKHAKTSVVGTDVSVQEANALREEGLMEMALVDKELIGLSKEKRAARLRLSAAILQAIEFEREHGINPADATAVAEYRGRFEHMASAVARNVARSRHNTHAFHPAMRSMRARALKRAQSRLLVTLEDTHTFPAELALIREEHDSVAESLHASQHAYDQAKEKVSVSDSKLAEIRRIEAEVEKQIARMQAELAAFDERIRLRIEKELVLKGLRIPRTEGYKTPTFIWPIEGSITVTAGFLEASYQRYFGVPHKAVDVRLAQGSPVLSSAPGIVYHVQHGGQYGYSYILIGHRGKFATLYGHMSKIHVEIGDSVDQGQVIGLSGGMPGTIGAGPMTTGPHLHFEVIDNGTHIDPHTVLPPIY